MLRHAAAPRRRTRAIGTPVPGGSNIYVAGHSAMIHHSDADARRRLYLALLSIGARHADGMIRRVLIAEPFDGDGQHADWAAARLSGADPWTKSAAQWRRLKGWMSTIPASVLPRFTGRSAREWISATPVVLPGYDGLKVQKAGKRYRSLAIRPGCPPAVSSHSSSLARRRTRAPLGAGSCRATCANGRCVGRGLSSKRRPPAPLRWVPAAIAASASSPCFLVNSPASVTVVEGGPGHARGMVGL